jgi:carboxylesterase type B
MIDPRKHPHELISKNGYGLNVIVIAPAYRVNIFGFLGAGDEGLSGNWGFWDQRCAMEWVAENVKYFGGDPENVTLGGVSAGILLCYLSDVRGVFGSGTVVVRVISGGG